MTEPNQKSANIRALQLLAQLSFDELRDYAQVLVQALDAEKKSLDSYTKQVESDLEKDGFSVAPDFWEVENHLQTKAFPCLAWKSVFLMTYSTFEYHLLRMCKELQTLREESFGPQDLKGEFNGARKFLDRLYGIKMSANKVLWPKVDKLRQLRNYLTHEGGRLDKTKSEKLLQELKDLDEDLFGISVRNGGEIVLENAFCIYAIEKLNLYTDELSDRVISKV